MKKINLFSVLLLSAFIIQCGGNPEQDGDNAYDQGKYNQALSYYLQVKKSNPDNPKINEKIALAYMQKGLQIFEKTKNIAAFSGNFEKGENFIPEAETSPEFDGAYSILQYKLALAYHEAKPANEIQKEQYFTKTLDLLEMALVYNSENTEAENQLTQIKTENFEETYQKGLGFFTQAKKEKNPDLYLSAEHYLKRAVFFDPENPDALKQLGLVRRKTMSILDIDSRFPIAIADKQYANNHLLIAVTAMNNTGEDMTFDPQKITLVGTDGQKITLDTEFTGKFEDGLVETKAMTPRQQIDGTLAFAVKKSLDIVSINYALTEETEVVKYLK